MHANLRSIMVALLVALPTAAAAESTPDAPDCLYDDDQGYRVATPTEVYTGPSETRRIIYDLPATARAIRCVGPCRNAWCRIRWHGVVGWIRRENLIADGKVTWTTEPFD